MRLKFVNGDVKFVIESMVWKLLSCGSAGKCDFI